MTATFSERLREARRLALLQLLAQTPDLAASAELLYGALPDQGVAASHDQVASDLAWLSEQGLVGLRTIGDTDKVLARITARGIDAANGRAIVPGVARPGPGASL